jgi:hypothetical protein
MKKIFLFTFFVILILLSIFVFILSTKGIETSRFNSIISTKINKIDNRINIRLEKIKIKLDLKELSFFLLVKDPNIKFSNEKIIINEIKVYSNLRSLIKQDFKISKIFINTGYMKVKVIKKIILTAKPSNLKSLLLNNIRKGSIKTKINLELDKDNNIENYNIDGIVKLASGIITNNEEFEKTNFIFALSKDEGTISSINGNIFDFKINSGKINYVNKNNNLYIQSTLNSDFIINKDKVKKLFSKKISNKLFENIFILKGNVDHKLMLSLDSSLKILDYDYSGSGKIEKGQIELKVPFNNQILSNKIQVINVKKSNFNLINKFKKDKLFAIDGKYALNESEYNNFKIENNFNNLIKKFNIIFDTNEELEIFFLNYKKNKNTIANIEANITLSNKELEIKNFTYKENDTLLSLNEFKLDKKNNLNSFKKIKIKTYNKNKINNNFEITYNKNLSIKGNKFDATNLIEEINKDSKKNFLSKISKKILVELDNVITSLPKKINKFNLHGIIEKGKFIKINSKGEFGDNKYLDITLKKDKKTNIKYLEIYSDYPEPILSNFSFFKGLAGGELLFQSSIDEKSTISKLTIDNFKVINAPGFVKLLSLADLGGMADLLTGKGLSFDKLEMHLIKNDKILELEEFYALGPSVSIVMDGYVDSKTGLVSLKGSMIPAKTLNKFISKVPVVGNILIPKQYGEGLFGISFKMKGLPGKIKTSVNPLKTITPRFIQKALEKNKSK